MNTPEARPTDDEIREIQENLEFYLEMDVADEVARDPSWDKPMTPEGDTHEFPRLP